MKSFIQRSGRVTYLSNVVVSLLCTSSLLIGYYNAIENTNKISRAIKIVADDTEVVSKTKNNVEQNATIKATTIVARKKVNNSNKNYTPAKYNVVTGEAIINYAKKYTGLRYVSGGNSLETGTDCSGFTKLIYKEFGINLPRSAVYQAKSGSYIKKSDLQKGDLVFYGYGDGKVHHVGIYIGNSQVIHESNKRDGVKISSVNMMEYITARRVINETANKIVESQIIKENTNTYTNNEYTENNQPQNSNESNVTIDNKNETVDDSSSTNEKENPIVENNSKVVDNSESIKEPEKTTIEDNKEIESTKESKNDSEQTYTNNEY